MLRSAALAGALILSASCNKSEGGDSLGSAVASSAGSAKPQAAGGSISAELARDLGAVTPKPEGAPATGSAGQAGSATGEAKTSEAKASEAKTGEAKAGEAKAGTMPDPGAKAVDAKAGDAKAGDAKAGDAKAGDAVVVMTGAKPDPGAKAVDAKAVDAKAGSAVVAMTGAKPDPGAKAGSDASGPSGAGGPAPEIRSAPVSHRPAKVPVDLAAIKLSLLPNWDRDVDEPGTFQYVVRIKGTQSTKTFTFRYGYDDAKAPADRDQYKKYLQDTRTLTGEIRDRQRGAAWFLEGNDASGMPAFRYVVLYGGKRLVCYGSLYKDAEGNRLGDDRDQTVIQAKQICETLAL